MKKLLIITLLLFIAANSQAQIPGVSLVTGLIKKVIIAIDLKVQQLQNQTIALQNAEQAVENDLSLNKLNDIGGWLQKEKALYQNYYDELAKVKAVIADYETVRRVITQQAQLVSEYQTAKAQFSRDSHFSPAEIKAMGQVYENILAESIRNLDELTTAVTALATQMSDGDRLEVIRRAAAGVQHNLDDLRHFNRSNQQLSLARSRDAADQNVVRKLYGLN